MSCCEISSGHAILIGRKLIFNDKQMENQTGSPADQKPEGGFIKNKARIIYIVALIALIAAGMSYKYNQKKQVSNQEALKQKTFDFIKNNLVQPGTDVQVSGMELEDKSIYRLNLKVANQEAVVYVTKDGSKLFLQAIEMDKKKEEAGNQSQQNVATEAQVKTDKPEVELFVMSHCPYGTQAEKGIVPAIQKLGSKVNFKLKFVDYILHGKKEFDENLFQYCVQKEQPSKLFSYLECFNKSGDSGKCLISAKIDKSKVDSCISNVDKNLKLTEAFNAGGQTPPFAVDKGDVEKYKVQGSPTLVINGTVINGGRDSASMLKAICSGFQNQPEECKANLSSATPSAGFGEGSAAASAGGSCGQ